MASKERENFYKNSALIVDHAKDSLVDVLEFHLTLRSLSFEDFINLHQHDIYHLCFNKRRCCQCPHGYVLPHNRVLYPSQLEILLDKYGVARPCHVPGRRADFCCCLAKPGVTTNVLDITLARCLLINFCDDVFRRSSSLQNNIDTLLQMRNNVYGHAKERRITNVNYRTYKNKIESAILEIAKVCGNETKKKQILMDVEKRSLDETLCIQYHYTLSEQIAKERQLEEKLNDLAEKNPEIIEKAVVTAFDGDTEQKLTKDPQSPMMGASGEIKVDKELLSKGTFISYDNCVYLAGACNVGKSTLASILIGEEISQDWKSTDGLTIYFGRNGIDLKNKEMVPLKQDFDADVLSKVIRGKPEKPDTTHREEVLPHDSNKGNIIPETHTDTQCTDITAPTPSLVPGTGQDDVNITDPVRQQSPQDYIITTIQEDIKEQIRKGTYKMEIAPSDLVDFGGQRSFDMTHQLFMRRKGTFVLMFNGSIDFLVHLKEYEQGETTESISKHWVNSILSYCGDDEDILPIIMFCATHSDDFNQEDRIARKAELIHNLRELFENHKRKHRIIYDDIFFINGKDKNDLEIKRLKSKLVEVAFKQKSWGERVPMAWVPLDLHMSKMRVRNVNIISKEELTTLNQRNGDLALPVKEITNFLNVQHSLGKILYIDQHGLDNFIVVQPQSLVNILRSFITAEHFWPQDKKLRCILCTLSNTGKITRQDLLKLWSQEKFHQHMPSDDLKEFIIQVLVHLDILVEPRHYRQENKSKNPSYLVPCMVEYRLPLDTDFYVKSADKMLSLSYTLLKSSIPAALSFKLIGAAINLWPLKKTKEGICLYHQAAILCIDGSNELHLLAKDDKVFVYLINKVTKCFISPNMASMVQECLTLTITKVLEFYHKSFGKSLSTLDLSKAFKIEVGEWCTSGGGCYISVLELEKETEWRCKNDKTHDKTYPRYWISNKKQVECDEKCPGLDEKYLELPPGDKHLFKLAKLITVNQCDNLFIKLGLSPITWKDIRDTDRYENTVKKYLALCEWKDLKYRQIDSKPSFKQLYDALAEDYHRHFLCQLFMEDVTVYDIANSALQEIPEDDVLQYLSKEVGNCAVDLGVELGLSMAAIKGILVKHPQEMFKQNFGVMEQWKSSSKVRPTILMLMKAFQSADGEGLKILMQKYMGNDQRGQGYQSSIEPDAEPYISSVNNKRVHDFENKTGEEATQKVDMKTMKILAKVSKSIGMFVGKIQGSCWRAGTDLIVTAWHVVRDHIKEHKDLNEEKLKKVKIKFDYTDSGDCDESNIFKVEPRVLYYNETLDTAILRLKPNDKVVTFPPPFRQLDHFLIPAKDEDLMIYLIAHPDGSHQQVNLNVGLWNPTEERMQSLATFCKDEGHEYDGYAELDKTERLVVKCEFEHGASGCPGVVILDDNQVYLVTMFLRGFPGFYYNRLFKEEKKKKFPKSKLFQQGVNIEAIYDDLKKNPMYADIFKDIFKQNPPVNMGPSGIIPSENYTDGYQDCHDRVSTSTQPTSDEGTHHVTSPCEEETNENVSTCTHPTTVERQGSQMVVSEGSSPVRGTKRKLEEGEEEEADD